MFTSFPTFEFTEGRTITKAEYAEVTKQPYTLFYIQISFQLSKKKIYSIIGRAEPYYGGQRPLKIKIEPNTNEGRKSMPNRKTMS